LLTDPFSAFHSNKDTITTSDVLAKWTTSEKGGGQTSAQVYYDFLDYPYTNASATSSTFDVDLQRQLPTMKNHSVIVGAGYRYMNNDSTPGITQSLDPLNRHDTIFSLFGQDEISVSDKGRLTLGPAMSGSRAFVIFKRSMSRAQSGDRFHVRFERPARPSLQTCW
jgi:outer membrane receptor for ferrienterochelin and colicin